MKTTIDIADDLLAQGKQIAEEEHVTLRSLVEEGLRYVLTRRGHIKVFRWKPVTIKGRGLNPEFADAGWDGVRGAIYPMPDSKR
ncbi:MAG TPA: DUF2191 domain-containing protein [Fibrobacteria bacterium]|nr:DUF2191 domain-containing protein [Fibrobacteria bacterium]